MSYNDRIQSSLDGIRSGLAAAFNVDPNSTFIKVPVLFYPDDPNYPTYPSPPDPNDERTLASAYTPDMVNCIIINDRLLVPKPFVATDPNDPNDPNASVFEEHVRNSLTGTGLSAHFIDDWEYYHCWLGELHCGTNVERAAWTRRWWMYSGSP